MIEMTGSALAHVLIVLAAAGGVAAMIGLVLLAARRPYFRHPRPDPMPGKVRGGMHLGDPRSLAPPEWERADTPTEPGREEPSREESSRAESSREEPSRAESSQREPGRAAARSS